jgi:MerR-like DNA binding protein
MAPLLSSDEACRRSGVSYRQLDFWVRTHAIWPARDAAGSGSRRGWSEADIHKLALIGKLIAAIGGHAIEASTVGHLWAHLSNEGVPERWLLLGFDTDGSFAFTRDDGEPKRSGLLLVP